jgi:hypothetical protein
MSVTVLEDGRVDVTEVVECFEQGKTFECECGQGFGVEFDVVTVNCPSCNRVLIDMKPNSREPPEKNGQTGIDDWL